jgi:N6-adenosine-specific RNA methylase IME4
MTEPEWAEIGRQLGRAERSVQWWVGEWWMYGDAAFRQAKAIVTAPDWDGPAYDTCRRAALCCKVFPSGRRRPLLSFSHHREVVSLPPAEAEVVLDRLERQATETGKPPSTRAVRTEVKQIRRAKREAELGAATERAAAAIGPRLYGVIYADPPWRFEPYSRITGMDRAADNHYPTMTLEAIKQLRVPAAEDAVLFLWATAPMQPEAFEVMAAWGFTYRSQFIWLKPVAGTGYWNRNRHEHLLVGTRGDVPAPAPGEQFDSVISAPSGRHSEKPPAFAEMIEEMFPSLPRLEMFARGPRPGWDVWGNEAWEELA